MHYIQSANRYLYSFKSLFREHGTLLLFMLERTVYMWVRTICWNFRTCQWFDFVLRRSNWVQVNFFFTPLHWSNLDLQHLTHSCSLIHICYFHFLALQIFIDGTRFRTFAERKGNKIFRWVSFNRFDNAMCLRSLKNFENLTMSASFSVLFRFDRDDTCSKLQDLALLLFFVHNRNIAERLEVNNCYHLLDVQCCPLLFDRVTYDNIKTSIDAHNVSISCSCCNEPRVKLFQLISSERTSRTTFHGRHKRRWSDLMSSSLSW